MASANPRSTISVAGFALGTALGILFGPATRSALAYQERSPVVTGSVVDHDPTAYFAPGDSVESGMLIGHINGVERRGILEFNIADLVPGVVDWARITGRVGPNNSFDTGMRTHEVNVTIGDGVLNVADNNLNGNGSRFSVGWFEHASGGSTSYDINITRAFRGIMSEDPSYLREIIYASNNPQGWDAVSSTAPYAPKLQLQVRPTTASTIVFYSAPHAAAAASAQGAGAFTINASASSAPVMDWANGMKGRALLEYDLSTIPTNAKVSWAKLDLEVDGLQTSGFGTIGPDLQLMGYAGDGVVTVSDATSASTLIGTSGKLTSVGSFAWNLDTSFVDAMVGASNYLALRFDPGTNPECQAAIDLDWTRSYALPHLAIAYTLPLLADVNLDGLVNALDIKDFVAVLVLHNYQVEADCNNDGLVNALDIAGFVQALTHASGSATSVPEPAALSLLAFASLAFCPRQAKR